MTLKLVRKLTLSAALGVAVLAGWSYARVGHPVASRLAEDVRNAKVSLWAYHRYGLLPSVLVLDLRSVDVEASQADVLRALLQSAEGLKDFNFDRVVLAHRGKPKLMLNGGYFQTLGREFKTQNPLYTMRTLPENVRKLDGSAAYGTWKGGWLGVLGKQMEDFRKFSEDWYLTDLAIARGR